jgi:predicted Zn finger-like uncharacterized protein
MTVHCPHCSTGYLLPDHLVGPRGARVRCPQCAQAFVVLPEEAADAPPEPAPAEAPRAEPAPAAAMPAPAHTPRETLPLELDPAARAVHIARVVLDDLEQRLGPALDLARARGRMLAEHGPALFEAYERYRREAGPNAAPDAFRSEVRQRWAVDLTPGRERTT